MTLSILVAAVSAGLLLVAWVIYPMARALRGFQNRPGIEVDYPANPGEVAVVLATRDHPAQVGKKVHSLLNSPESNLIGSVVVSVDPSGAWKLEQYSSVQTDSRVSLILGRPPGGKALALNAAVAASPPIKFLLIVDTAQTLRGDAISALTSSIKREGWGGASGIVIPEQLDPLGKAWNRLELGIRLGQAASKGLVTTSGAITMLRREAWQNLPSGTICDDLFLTMRNAREGRKIGLSTEAIAMDPRVVSPRDAFGKRVRTLTGLLQFLLRLDRDSIYPTRNPLWLDLFFHKVMRLLTPFLMAGTIFGTAYAWYTARQPDRFEETLFGLTLLLVPMILSLVSVSWRWRIATLFAPLVAAWNAVRGDWDVWNQANQES